jgi:hypothetical protein
MGALFPNLRAHSHGKIFLMHVDRTINIFMHYLTFALGKRFPIRKILV